MAMQSTGQGATHSSHPVHSARSTVCICWWAPRMASTGHGGRHLAQPMQASSRSEEHTSELQSRLHLVCRLLLEKKKNQADLGRVHRILQWQSLAEQKYL